jgi:transcriptional regulator with XRE-family HTH domain
VRRQLDLSQDTLAAAVGITRDQLANIETGRTVLNFEIGWKICRHLNVDPLYLASGIGAAMPFYNVDLEGRNIRGSDSFRIVCATQLLEELEFSRALSRALSGNKQLFAEFQADALAPAYERAISGIVKAFLAEAPPQIRKLALEYIARSLREFLDVHAKRKLLTDISECVKHSPMKAQLPSLLERLKKATEERGSKSALAAYLGLPLASVSQWLSGDREPGGETTLRLLHWVMQQESQQKESPGRAQTRPERKTRVRKSGYDKQTQVRKKG